ncbi:glutathione S-transferase family protein [Paradevosia shaoguanensis]|uniref:Glutathione S-transferase family protein n=1 Tax=Paradevosia shaoguanensis TaxID=1335043 RepID=A0AA41QN90_9HYPH|nr:glutathione S-transferase family protein [Paradevosia shaoguanensis]MCF1742138.1 glutathione S-transferase family protein [Paradevosia shaoguanensis]MCI0126621.1 glutathione S-transferase family protein [Paradevosia shaoguanensis]
MAEALTIWTYDWVPEGKSGPRGHVRDIRLRWACEEAGFDYDVKSVPFSDRGAEHFARQPFGQVPYLEDDGLTIFESGAGLLHLARKSEALMPRDPKGEADTLQWTIAGLSSIEMITVPWWFIGLSRPEINPLEDWALHRLKLLDDVLAQREWLAAGRFIVADILMSDVLRVPKVRAAADFPATQSYIERACARPAFKRAYDGQMAHFASGGQTQHYRP